jgi:hypothetical protein
MTLEKDAINNILLADFSPYRQKITFEIRSIRRVERISICYRPDGNPTNINENMIFEMFSDA